MRSAKFGLVLLALLFFWGCAGLKPSKELPDLGEKKKTPKSIRAEAVVELKKIITLSGRGTIMAKNPDRFRIEVLGPFNHVMALLVSDGTTLYAFSGGEIEKKDWEDPALPYSFKAKEVVSFLLGSQYPKNKASLKEDNIEVLTDKDGHISKIVKYKKGSASLTVKMSDYRDISGAHIPFNIHIEDGKRTLKIKYSDVEIDPELSEDFFSLEALP